MFRKLKSKLVIILCLIFPVVLCSCGGNMTDQTVRDELERLLPLSYEMNEIFWGKGLEYQTLETNDRYMPVTEDCPYKTTQEILDKASEVFSEEYIAIIKDAIFTDSEDIDPRYIEVNGVLKADKTQEGFNIQGNIVIESAVVKKQNRTTVIVSAQYEDGVETEIILALQNGKWYLNSPTY